MKRRRGHPDKRMHLKIGELPSYPVTHRDGRLGPELAFSDLTNDRARNPYPLPVPGEPTDRQLLLVAAELAKRKLCEDVDAFIAKVLNRKS